MKTKTEFNKELKEALEDIKMPIKRIDLTETEKDHMSSYINLIRNADAGFDLACDRVRQARKTLRDELKKIHPEAGAEGARFNYDEGYITYYDEGELKDENIFC